MPFRITLHLFGEVRMADRRYLLAVSWSKLKLNVLVLEHLILKALISLEGERFGGRDQLLLAPV